MDFLASLVSGVIAGLISSVIFIAILRRWLKPDVYICENACWCYDEFENRHFILFKIVNKAPRQAIDLKIRLDRVRDATHEPGAQIVIEKVNLLTENIMSLNQKDIDGVSSGFYYRIRTASPPNPRFDYDIRNVLTLSQKKRQVTLEGDGARFAVAGGNCVRTLLL